MSRPFSLHSMTPFMAAILLLGPQAVAAQEPASSFDQLNARLKVGDKVRVVAVDGKVTRGVVEGIGKATLLLREGTREPENFPAALGREVHTYVSDSLKNGIIAGAALGAVGGIALVVVGSSQGGDAEGGTMLAVIGGFAAVGALIGGITDSQRVRTGTVLYRAPGGRSSAHCLVAPLLTRTTKGVVVSLSFR